MYHLLTRLRNKILPLYRHFSDFKVFYRWYGLHNFHSLRRVFCVFNHIYIKWKYFLDIFRPLSLITSCFCAFTAFVLLLYIFFSDS